MITLFFSPCSPWEPNREQEKRSIIFSLFRAIASWMAFEKYMKGMEWGILPNGGFAFTFVGITTNDDKSMHFFVRAITNIYRSIDKEEKFYICRSRQEKLPTDSVYDYLEQFSKTTHNAKQLEESKVAEDKIPPKFLCMLTNQIMDTPAYFTDHPEQIFEKEIIESVTMSDGHQLHPFTRVPIDYRKLQINTKLQTEIEYFVARETGNYAQDRIQLNIVALLNSPDADKAKKGRAYLIALATMLGTAPPRATPLISVTKIEHTVQHPVMQQYSVSFARFWLEHDLPKKGYEDLKKESGLTSLDTTIHRW